MTRRPLAPDLWEQALINGRMVHPSSDEDAIGYAHGWYKEQGGLFDPPEEPEEAGESGDPVREALESVEQALENAAEALENAAEALENAEEPQAQPEPPARRTRARRPQPEG